MKHCKHLVKLDKMFKILKWVCLSQGLANRAFSRSTPRRLRHLCLVLDGRVPKRVLSGWQDEAEVWGYPRPVKRRSPKDLRECNFRPSSHSSPSWENPTRPYSTETSVIHINSYPLFFLFIFVDAIYIDAFGRNTRPARHRSGLAGDKISQAWRKGIAEMRNITLKTFFALSIILNLF